ncbi:MAG: hypothetical protein H0W70_02710 [Actinobacteria bacterium]|nr:hypothetical protein [Actinomycetota bacterium]
MTFPIRRTLAALALGLAAVAGLGCSGRSSAGASKAASVPYTQFKFDPANFVDPTLSTNELHPLRPGTQWVRTGTTEVGRRKVPHSAISTMTDVVREIDGVKAIAMLDQSTDSGEVSEVGFDYFALDKDGNVWIMGGYTEDFQGGAFTGAGEAWLGKETGGVPGVLVPGKVRADTQRWAIAAVEAKDKPSLGEPVQVGIRKCVKFGCFDNVTVIREGEFKAIDNELKYYAPGVGVIFNDPKLASLHQDSFELVNIVQLTAEGLAEQSKVVLDLEEHGRTTVPRVYGSAKRSTRLS